MGGLLSLSTTIWSLIISQCGFKVLIETLDYSFAEFFNKNSEGVGLRNVFLLPINNTDMGICVIDVAGKMGGLKNGPTLKAFFLKIEVERFYMKT